MSAIDRMPLDAWILIYFRLDVESLFRLMGTNKLHYNNLKSDKAQLLWHYKFKIHFPKMIRMLEMRGVTDWYNAFLNCHKDATRKLSPRMKNAFTLAIEGDLNRLELMKLRFEELTLANNNGDSIMNVASLGGQQHILDYLFTQIVLPIYQEDKSPKGAEKITYNLGQADILHFQLIHYAAATNQKSWVQHHTEEGININSATFKGKTPLFYAAMNGHVHIAELLISNGADIEKKNSGRLSPLNIAAYEGNLEMVRLLLEKGARIESRDSSKATPLLNAVIKNHLEVAGLLLEYGADLSVKDKGNQTPLIVACNENNNEMIHLLLNFCNEGNYATELDQILARNSTKLTKLFLMRCPNIKILDNALHIQTSKKNKSSLACIQLLLDHGANINSLDNDGNTALHRAIANDDLKAAELLLCNGADHALRDHDGYTPLHIAIRDILSLDMVNLLLSHGASVDDLDSNSITPLMWAAYKSASRITERLIQAGANINATDNLGRSALHLAAVNSTQTMCRLLIFHGANVYAQTILGDTPLNFATLNKSKNTIKELQIKLLSDYIDERGAPEQPEYLTKFTIFGKDINIGFSKECKIRNVTAKIHELSNKPWHEKASSLVINQGRTGQIMQPRKIKM